MELYLVFELLETDLHALIKNKRKRNEQFTEDEIQVFIFSILRGLSYIHKWGFFHRDLKPDNILIQTNNDG